MVTRPLAADAGERDAAWPAAEGAVLVVTGMALPLLRLSVLVPGRLTFLCGVVVGTLDTERFIEPAIPLLGLRPATVERPIVDGRPAPPFAGPCATNPP